MAVQSALHLAGVQFFFLSVARGPPKSQARVLPWIVGCDGFRPR